MTAILDRAPVLPAPGTPVEVRLTGLVMDDPDRYQQAIYVRDPADGVCYALPLSAMVTPTRPAGVAAPAGADSPVRGLDRPAGPTGPAGPRGGA